MNENQDKRQVRHDKHSVRRIVLPSGRSIEVVRFEADERTEHGLHICRHCDSELVQPVCWSETSDHRWELTLECPNCGWTEDGVFEREQLDQLEEKLDDGLAEMLADLKRLTQANMADEIDRFVSALNADHILPEDF
jgi:hypothetical protein